MNWKIFTDASLHIFLVEKLTLTNYLYFYKVLPLEINSHEK